MKPSNHVKQRSSPKRRPAPPPPRIPKTKKDHELKRCDLLNGNLKSELKSEVKHITPTKHPKPLAQFDPMEIKEVEQEQLSSSDQIALNVDQNIPSRRRSTLIDMAGDAVQSVVAYINRPYTPSPEVLAFLESLYLTEEELKDISMEELDQLITQSWYGRFLNGFASNHVFFKIFAFWYLDESGIKLHDLCEPHGDIEAIELDKITSWDKDIALEDKGADLLKEEESDDFRSFTEFQDVKQQNDKDRNKKNKKSEQQEIKEPLIEQNTKSYFARRVWPKNRCLLFESQTILSRAYSVEEMTNQLRWFNKIWAILLLSLLSNDIYFYYKYPERRYDNTLAQILLSKSKHSKMLSRSLTSVTVWPELVALPLVLAIYGAIWKRYHPTRAIPQEAIVDIEKYWQTYQPSIKQDLFYPVLSLFMPGFLSKRLGLHPFPDSRYNLNNISKTILWDGQIPAEDKIKLFEAVQIFLKQTSKLNKINLLTLIEELAENIHPRDTERLKKAGYDKETIKALLHIQSKSLAILKEHSQWSTNSFVYALYAHFLLWNIGQPETNVLQPLFWGFQGYRWYATVNFFIVLALGLQQIIGTYLAKKECEEAGKLWVYMDQVADYQCTVCGDLPVYYGHVFTSEDCIHAWFETNPRTSQELIDFAKNRIGRVDFSHMKVLNLNKHYINGKDLAQFLKGLGKRAINLETLTLEMDRPLEFDNYPLDVTSMEALVCFLKTIPIHTVNLRWQFLGDQEAQILGQALNKTELKMLDLYGNTIGDIGAQSIGQGLSGAYLQTLDLRYNNIGDVGAQSIGLKLSDSSLQTLFLADNVIGNIGAQGIGSGLPGSSLQTLDLSWNAIKNVGAQGIGSGLPGSSLQTIDLSRNEIQDVGAQGIGLGLPGSNLRTLDLSWNAIQGVGAQGIGQGLPGSSLQTLFLADNVIGNIGAQGIGSGLPGSSLRMLGLTGCNIGDIGARSFNFSNTRLQTLLLGFNDIRSAGAEGLGLSLSGSNLQTLDLSENNIGDTGVAGLGSNLFGSNLQTLQLIACNIGNVGAEGLGLGLFDSSLQMLILDYNNIGDSGAQGLSLGLSSSNLSTLTLYGNSISNAGAAGLGTNLFGSKLHTLDLGYNNIGDTGAQGIGSGLSGSNLQTLLLSDNSIGDVGAAGLGSGFLNTSLRELDLSSNHIASIGAQGLGLGLPGSNLQKLNLYENNIGPAGAEGLGLGLPGSSLRELDLSYNNISAAGAEGLSLGFPGSGLKILNLLSNRIGNVGAKKLGQGLPGSNLQILRLYWNSIGDKGAKELGLGFSKSNLQQLYLSHNDIGDDGVTGLSEGLAGSKLQVLSLRHNLIGDTGAIGIAGSLTTESKILHWIYQFDPDIKRMMTQSRPSTRLEYLYLARNSISDMGAEVLCRVLPYSGMPLKGLHLEDNPIDNPSLKNYCEISSASSLQLPLPFRLLRQFYRSMKETIWPVRIRHNTFLIEEILTEVNENKVFTKDIEEKLYAKEIDETRLLNSYQNQIYLSNDQFELEMHFEKALPSFQRQNNISTIPSFLMFFMFGVMLLWIYKSLFNNMSKSKREYHKTAKTPRTSHNKNNFWLPKQEKSDIQLIQPKDKPLKTNSLHR